MDRKLSAILAADVVGYSALMEADEAGTHERLKAGRKELFEPEIARHHGRVFKLMGDGMLAEFGSVVDAVECAVSLQRGLAERNAAVAEDQRIQVRIGVNLGEVIVEGEDRYGEGVNIAARLEQLAEPGGIWVSAKVAREVEKKLAFGFEPMGDQKVKNIAEPVEAFRVKLDGVPVKRRAPVSPKRALPWAVALAAVAALAAIWFTVIKPADAPPALASKPSVAVLPFDNLSADPKWDRFAEAMTENIITDLSHSHDLLVIARNSTEIYKDKAVDVREVGRDLGVRYVLEGSIQPLGDRIRATAQLIDAANGSHVWSERYDRPMDDLFAVEGEITGRIAATLAGFQGVVAGAERKLIRRKPPGDLTAFDYYLLAMAAKHTVTKEGLVEAEKLFKQSIALDPNLARAYVGLAYTYTYNIDLGMAQSVPEAIDKMMEVARKAVELDPDDGDTHMVLGIAYAYRGEVETAVPEIERAQDLAPNNADLLITSAVMWPGLGKPEHAVDLARRAVVLNPRYPYWYIQFLRNVHFYGRNFEESLGYAKRVTDPVALDFVFIAMNAAYLGRADEAKAAAAQVTKLDPHWIAELWISDTGGFARDEESDLFVEGARKAGIRACLSAAELKERPATLRLKSCEAERARS